MAKQTQRGYYESRISEITGFQNVEDLIRIEECMRIDLFHSTLDWLSAEQFDKGAFKAIQVLRLGAEMGYWDHLNSDQEDSNNVSSL
jgi:hypothetical protein